MAGHHQHQLESKSVIIHLLVLCFCPAQVSVGLAAALDKVPRIKRMVKNASAWLEMLDQHLHVSHALARTADGKMRLPRMAGDVPVLGCAAWPRFVIASSHVQHPEHSCVCVCGCKCTCCNFHRAQLLQLAGQLQACHSPSGLEAHAHG
jgi:hypothetical protein